MLLYIHMNGLTLVGLAVAIWSIGSGIIAKGFTVPALAWYPAAALIGTVLIALWMYKEGILAQLWPSSKAARWLLIAGGVCMTFNNGFFFTALQHTTVAIGLLSHYLTPMLVAVLFAPLFLREKLTVRDLVITVVGLAGLAVVLWPELSQSQLGVGAVYGILSAIFFAFGVVVNRKLGDYKIGGLAGVVYQNFVPVLLMSPVFFSSFNAGAFTSGDWWRVATFGLLSLSIGFGLFWVGLQKVQKAAHASVLSYGEPIGAIILAAIFLGEPLTLYVIVGTILIVGAGVAIVLGERQPN